MNTRLTRLACFIPFKSRKCNFCNSYFRFSLSASQWLNSANSKIEFTQLQKLSVDETFSSKQNQKARLVKNALFTKVDPTPLKSPKIISLSSAITDCIDLDISSSIDNDKITKLFSGDSDMRKQVLPDCTPYSHCYAGHQFGSFAGQLGDGRAICFGEYINDKNERWEMQIKGAGLTPFSRFADGRAVLRSSIREYLMSEAMHYLNVPTTVKHLSHSLQLFLSMIIS